MEALRKLRDEAETGEAFNMLQNLKAETDPGLLVVEKLESLREEEQRALKAKLERMQNMNPKEPKWEPSVHWPLLQKLNQLLGQGESRDYIPEKDRRDRRS